MVDIPWNSDRSRARNVLPSGIRMRRCCRMVGSRILQYGLRPCDGSRLERLIMVWLGRVSSCNVGLLVWHFLSVSLPIRCLEAAARDRPLLLRISGCVWLRATKWARPWQGRQRRQFLGPLDGSVFQLQRVSWTVLWVRASVHRRRSNLRVGTMRGWMILPIRRVEESPRNYGKSE